MQKLEQARNIGMSSLSKPQWRPFVIFLFSSMVAFLLFSMPDQNSALAHAQPFNNQDALAAFSSTEVRGFGILGDSNSDEYRADDNRGGEYSTTTLNWVEQLVLKRGLNFGPWGTWGEPRRTGYKYNWGRSGATASSMISSGQHTGLAEQIANGEISHVFIWIGVNDFHPTNGTYNEIYDGSLSDADLQNKIDQFVADTTLAVDTLLAAGEVKIVLATLADPGVAPDMLLAYPNSTKRQRVTEAITQVNDKLEVMAEERHIAIANVNKFAANLVARLDKLGRLHVGNQPINLLIKGDEPSHLRLDDSVGHAGTVASGLIANALFVETFNNEYGLHIALLTDEEILTTAGISPSASNGCLGSLPFLAIFSLPVVLIIKQRSKK